MQVTVNTALLFANEAFYHAFQGRDREAMAQVWARNAAVSCIHPGWPPLFGREAVMKSWVDILSSPRSPSVVCRAAEGRQLDGIGIVVCYEEIDSTYLVATNLFVQEAATWRLMHHQAGPCNAAPTILPETEGSTALQ